MLYRVVIAKHDKSIVSNKPQSNFFSPHLFISAFETIAVSFLYSRKYGFYFRALMINAHVTNI